MQKKFYITTPIYYGNGPAHIGHAYTSLLCDIIARTKRFLGYKVKFATGLDENGQKMLQKAQEKGKDIKDFLDEIYQSHLNTWEKLQISYTDYIRTTQKNHHEFVKNMILRCYENNDIYKGKYEGLYCVGCESFKKESELIKNQQGELVCPDHLTKPEKIIEENYFFRLSKYKDFLIDFYNQNPNFVLPEFRFNEIKAFVEKGLEDFSISRKADKNDFRIRFPLDDEHVVYVWFDALFNYLTVCQGKDEEFWPADLHVMAKDITKFHAIYWPAMLKSAGFEMPKQIFSHGYFTVDGQKMSKTIGNVIDPVDIIQKYGRDALVLYLFSDIIVGNDGDFSFERFKGVYNGNLIGGWGNLVSRVSSLAYKNSVTKGVFYEDKFNILRNNGLQQSKNYLVDFIGNGFDINLFDKNFDINQYINYWYELVQATNKFMQDSQPWVKLKNLDTKEDGIKDLEFLTFMIRYIGILSSMFLIEGFEKLKYILQNQDIENIDTSKDLSKLDIKQIIDQKSFSVKLNPGYLYTKID